MRVGVFIPCFVAQLRPGTAERLLILLERLGVDVVLPTDAPACCGQPSYNAGLWREAACCAEKLVRAFEGLEHVVVPSASCAAMVQRYPDIPELDPALRSVCEQVATRTIEVCRFMVDVLGVDDVGARRDGAVAYHDGCHALRELGLKDEPRRLLRAVRDLELIEMDQAETCCGFGGTFAVKHPAISAAMADVKCQSLVATGAGYVVSGDPSCLLQIGGWLRRHQAPVRTLHLAEVLAAS
jgi:L-lactate dehydrogenase complex protein LldE